jgi:hypothetical protein
MSGGWVGGVVPAGRLQARMMINAIMSAGAKVRDVGLRPMAFSSMIDMLNYRGV